MTSIFTRSALMFWSGGKVANNVHSVVDGRIVTWDEVMENRRSNQRRRLEQIRYVTEFKAVKVWVGYFGADLMGGWNAFIENRYDRLWIDRDRKWLKEPLMKLFPVTLFDDFDQWKTEFAKRYRRRTQRGKPVGVAFAWFDGRHLARTASVT